MIGLAIAFTKTVVVMAAAMMSLVVNDDGVNDDDDARGREGEGVVAIECVGGVALILRNPGSKR